jgi:glycosyltransferase involved in cell wall biosynthesis
VRVLHVITGLAAGGAEQQLRLLLPHLAAAGVECEVVTLTNPGSVAEAIRADGTPVHHLGMRGNRDLTALPRLVQLIRRGQFDLVHTHLYRACLYGRLAARLAGVRRVVATEHSLGDVLIEGRRRTLGVRALYLTGERLGDVTIAVSDTVARRIRDWGVRGSRIVVVPNGIDGAQFRFTPQTRHRTRDRWNIPADAVVIGGVGRLEPPKRFEVLIRAVAALPDVRLVLVGEGGQRGVLEKLARALGAADRVLFTGETADVAAELAGMDVFVSPSGDEAFGLAVLEALANGLPVLYVRCPALEDLPAGSAPGATRIDPDVASMQAALATLPRTMARLAPPPAVAHYDISRLAGQVHQLYQDLVHHIPGRPFRLARSQPGQESADD